MFGKKAEKVKDTVEKGAKKSYDKGSCFVAGTLILTEIGLKPIEEIVPGDKVQSKSDQDGTLSYKTVLNTVITHPNTLVYLTYQIEGGAEQELITTPDHPFWVIDKGWVEASDLSLSDQFLIVTEDKTVELVGLRLERAPPESTFTTYNFEVNDYHTYFVLPIKAQDSSQAIWVHNNDKCPGGGEEAVPGSANPDRPLPRNAGGEPVPDPEGVGVAHTQLGIRNGRKGKYAQAREFDENGKPVRDIDFTDHGRKKNHPNPHQHIYNENPTGGTMQRDSNASHLENP